MMLLVEEPLCAGGTAQALPHDLRRWALVVAQWFGVGLVHAAVLGFVLQESPQARQARDAVIHARIIVPRPLPMAKPPEAPKPPKAQPHREPPPQVAAPPPETPPPFLDMQEVPGAPAPVMPSAPAPVEPVAMSEPVVPPEPVALPTPPAQPEFKTAYLENPPPHFLPEPMLTVAPRAETPPSNFVAEKIPGVPLLMATPAIVAPALTPVAIPAVATPTPTPVVASAVAALVPTPVVAPATAAPAPTPVAAPEVAVPAPAPVAVTVVAAAAPTPAVASVVAPPTSQAPLVPPGFNAAYLENLPPRYPSMSRRLGEKGRVLLRVFVSADGHAEHAEIKNTSGFERLDLAAREAVASWRFVPAKRGDEHVAAWVLVPVSFVM